VVSTIPGGETAGASARLPSPDQSFQDATRTGEYRCLTMQPADPAEIMRRRRWTRCGDRLTSRSSGLAIPQAKLMKTSPPVSVADGAGGPAGKIDIALPGGTPEIAWRGAPSRLVQLLTDPPGAA
jgi:hypothetical protein